MRLRTDTGVRLVQECFSTRDTLAFTCLSATMHFLSFCRAESPCTNAWSRAARLCRRADPPAKHTSWPSINSPLATASMKQPRMARRHPMRKPSAWRRAKRWEVVKARRVGVQSANEGYRVWCDLAAMRKGLGGRSKYSYICTKFRSARHTRVQRRVASLTAAI